MESGDPQSGDSGIESPRESEVYTIALAVAEQLGPDISYIRQSHRLGDSRLYFTGIEIGLTAGAGVFAAFLSGVVKGVVESVGKEITKALIEWGKTKIDPIRNRLAKTLATEDADFPTNNRQIGKELAESSTYVRDELTALNPAVDFIKLSSDKQIEEITEELFRYGFTRRRAIVHSQLIVQIIHQNWKR
jgi:hypothetical protein